MSTIADLGAFLRRETQAATTPARQEQTPDPDASQAADALAWPEEHLTGIVGAAGGRAISIPPGR